MASIVELEKRVIKNPKKAKLDDLNTLARHYWGLATDTNDFRQNRKHVKRSSFFAGFALAAGANAVEQLELYRNIFQRAAEVDPSPEGHRRKLSKVIARWLEKTGADKHRVVEQSKGRITVNGGLITIGDRAQFVSLEKNMSFDDEVFVQWANRGERLTFATGSDGIFRAELRLIEAVEPILTAKEYKKLTSSTSTVVIDVTSGALGMADFAHFLDEPWDNKTIKGTVCMAVRPGRYKACAFGFTTSRSDSVVVVVSATTDEPANDTKTVDRLFG